jgi:glycosyltransferase involved in cell wall biosynthesis
MNILVVTNIYPPQELGGYGRSIADFVWGLQQRGHTLQVLSSDAAELGESSSLGPSGEPIDRRLKLKGSYSGGVKHIEGPNQRNLIDEHNVQLIRHWINTTKWDGILLGNLDLLGPELLSVLLEANCKIQHHIGFVHPPFPAHRWPNSSNYVMVAASQAVRSALIQGGMPTNNIPVIYPGARTEQFGAKITGMPAPLPADGSQHRPLKVCFAGLLMMSKGVHTIIEAVIQLNRNGICIQASLAGDSFQQGYRQQLEALIEQEGLNGVVQFVGQLKRSSLARFYALHHVGVFPSIHPEAFGIVAAEMMASRLAVISSCVGGAGELIKHEETGLEFTAGNSQELAICLARHAKNSALRDQLAAKGQQQIEARFSVRHAAHLLEQGFIQNSEKTVAIF